LRLDPDRTSDDPLTGNAASVGSLGDARLRIEQACLLEPASECAAPLVVATSPG
jgi:hypothetical protein